MHTLMRMLQDAVLRPARAPVGQLNDGDNPIRPNPSLQSKNQRVCAPIYEISGLAIGKQALDIENRNLLALNADQTGYAEIVQT